MKGLNRMFDTKINSDESNVNSVKNCKPTNKRKYGNIPEMIMNNGFTQIPQDLFDQILKLKITGTQFRILFCVLRETFGWQATTSDLSLKYIQSKTGIDPSNINKAIKQLIEMKLLVMTSDYDTRKNKPRVIGINFKHILEVDEKGELIESVSLNDDESSSTELIPKISESIQLNTELISVEEIPFSENNHNPMGNLTKAPMGIIPNNKETIKEKFKEKIINTPAGYLPEEEDFNLVLSNFY